MTDARILSEREVWAAAGLLIEKHGDMAAIEASKKADHFLDTGDLAGQRAWLRVVRAIVSMTDATGATPN